MFKLAVLLVALNSDITLEHNQQILHYDQTFTSKASCFNYFDTKLVENIEQIEGFMWASTLCVDQDTGHFSIRISKDVVKKFNKLKMPSDVYDI